MLLNHEHSRLEANRRHRCGLQAQKTQKHSIFREALSDEFHLARGEFVVDGWRPGHLCIGNIIENDASLAAPNARLHSSPDASNAVDINFDCLWCLL